MIYHLEFMLYYAIFKENIKFHPDNINMHIKEQDLTYLIKKEMSVLFKSYSNVYIQMINQSTGRYQCRHS